MIIAAKFYFVTDKKNYFLLQKINGRECNLLSVPPQIKVQRKINYQKKEYFLTFGYWGFIRENKGLDNLLFAFKKYIEKGKNARLIILASLDDDNAFHRHIKRIITNLKIEKHIEIKGYLSSEKISEELINLDCCILPFTDGVSDRRGTFSTVMSMGLPVITTFNEKRFIPDGLKHLENVFLTDYHIYSLCEAMIKTEDESLRKYLGENAVLWSRKITWESVIEKIFAIYKKALS